MDTIKTDTPIIVGIIAEKVRDEWQAWLQVAYPAVAKRVQDKEKEVADFLESKANHLYAVNKTFKRTVRGRGNRGRDYLYAIMYHWMLANMLRSFPQVRRDTVPTNLRYF